MLRIIFASAIVFLAMTTRAFAALAPANVNAAFDDALVATLRADDAIPSVVARVRSPRLGLDWTGAAAGARERESSVALSERPFRVASVTKMFTAAAVLRLVESGRLDLDAPISRLISPQTERALRAGGYDPDRITITHLLGHASGLPDHADLAYIDEVSVNLTRRWTPEAQIALAMTKEGPLGRPGQAFHYSDTGYVILGEIIAARTGMPYAIAIRSLLKLDSLGLSATWYESLEPAQTAAPPLRQFHGDIDFTGADASFDLWGGGGIITTVDDLALFTRALLRGDIFDRPETLATALTVPFMEDETSGHAHNLLTFRHRFGRRTCYGHSGFWGVLALYCPADDLTVIMSVNRSGAREALFGLSERLAAIVESADASEP